MAKGSLSGAGEEDTPMKKRKQVKTVKKLNNSSQWHLSSHDSSAPNHLLSGPPKSDDGNPVSGYVTINLSSRSKFEIRELKSRLVDELGQIRALVKRIEAEEALCRCTESQSSVNDRVSRLPRLNSDAGSMMPRNSRQFRESTKPMASNGNNQVDDLVSYHCNRRPKGRNQILG